MQTCIAMVTMVAVLYMWVEADFVRCPGECAWWPLSWASCIWGINPARGMVSGTSWKFECRLFVGKAQSSTQAGTVKLKSQPMSRKMYCIVWREYENWLLKHCFGVLDVFEARKICMYKTREKKFFFSGRVYRKTRHWRWYRPQTMCVGVGSIAVLDGSTWTLVAGGCKL